MSAGHVTNGNLRQGTVYFRLRRDNRWVSVCLDDIDYLTQIELMEMPPQLAQTLVKLIEANPEWMLSTQFDSWVRKRN